MSLLTKEQQILAKLNDWNRKAAKSQGKISELEKELLGKSMTASLQEVHRLKNLILDERKFYAKCLHWLGYHQENYIQETGKMPVADGVN